MKSLQLLKNNVQLKKQSQEDKKYINWGKKQEEVYENQKTKTKNNKNKNNFQYINWEKTGRGTLKTEKNSFQDSEVLFT